jgi:hypothetical protein
MRCPRPVILGVAVTLAVGPRVAGETVSHSELGLRLTIPEGFAQDPARARGGVIYHFERPPVGDRKVATFVVVSRLGGTLGREKIDPKSVAAKNPSVAIVTERWKGFDIEVFRVPEQLGEIQMLTFNAQVPLKPEAVQVAVIGDARDEAELREILRGLLGTLEGETNWFTETQRSERLADGITRMIVAVVVLVGIGLVVWQVVRKRRKTSVVGRGRKDTRGRADQGAAPGPAN